MIIDHLLPKFLWSENFKKKKKKNNNIGDNSNNFMIFREALSNLSLWTCKSASRTPKQSCFFRFVVASCPVRVVRVQTDIRVQSRMDFQLVSLFHAYILTWKRYVYVIFNQTMDDSSL